MLNDGVECAAKMPHGLGLSQDGRGVSIRWVCGACGKEARYPIETRTAFVRKQCDWCCADNIFNLRSPSTGK